MIQWSEVLDRVTRMLMVLTKRKGRPSLRINFRTSSSVTTDAAWKALRYSFNDFPFNVSRHDVARADTGFDLAIAAWFGIPTHLRGTEGPRRYEDDTETLYLYSPPGRRRVRRPNLSKAGVTYPVWFGTNRKPINAEDISQGFSNERHGRTTVGRVDVQIPEAHRFGETGSSFWTRILRYDFRDDRLSIRRVVALRRTEFWRQLRRLMETASSAGEPRHGLVFLHGYNTDFADAAIRAAQIGFDLRVTGATAFFSWPSMGAIHAYTADEATIEASVAAITKFLVDFVHHSGAEKVHLIAHSMGNRALLGSLQRIAADVGTRTTLRFGQIFLAAPDIDRDLFLELAHYFGKFAERVTLYASKFDRAVALSARVHASPRAGYFLPYTVAPQIDTIAVPRFNVDLLGHGYFAQAEPLLHDIHDLIRNGDPPARRQRIESLEHSGEHLWRFRR
jgi:esterase/lipase superfamily enzyme